MNNLANFYREYGDYPQSLALQTKALERQKAVLGPDHPDTLLSMSNLALLHEARGDHAAALALSTETWKRRHDAFGSDHRDTLVSANNLATLYFELGQLAQALRILEDTLARRRRAPVRPPQHAPLALEPGSSLPHGSAQTGRTAPS